MATILQPPLAGGVNSFPPSPTLSASYPHLVTLKGELDYREDLDSKQSFAHAEYPRSFSPSIPSTAPSSPYYSQSMGSRDSYFSTPSYSSLDPSEDFSYDEEDDGFPLFENNVPHATYDDRRERHITDDRSSTSASTTTTSTPARGKSTSKKARDDHHIEHEPTRHVDYLSHDWEQHEDIWSSWKWITARRGKVTNCERLENASWRTWTKTKYNLRTISPESLNWMKDCDVTWLYGPLQVNKKRSLLRDRSPPPSQLSTCSSFLHKKPILKKKTPSALLLEKSQNEHTLLQRAGDIIQVQRSSPVPGRTGLRKGGSDFSLPSYHTSSVLNTPAESNDSFDRPPRSSFGPQTPAEAKHVFFNEEVRQVQAIESEDDEKEAQPEEDFSESDEDDDGGLMMAPARIRSNRSTPRGSFSDSNKTITPLPSTTLKYRKDTPEPAEIPHGALLWRPSRGLQHSSSQETLKPSKPSHNFLLDDDPEVMDEPWSPPVRKDNYSLYAHEDQSEPYGMRRTPSGMFMPYDENEEEAAMNNTLFGQAVYAVNTFRDIAHVVWNVGWNRGR